MESLPKNSARTIPQQMYAWTGADKSALVA